jgi:hypothetical protein
MKNNMLGGIDVGAELSKILLREINKEIAISISDKAIKRQYGFDDAILVNMQTYSECLDYDNEGAAESLTRAIRIIIMSMINKHCI